MKDTIIKKLESKNVLGFNSSKETLKLTKYEISESNMTCEICIGELWHEMFKKISYLRN